MLLHGDCLDILRTLDPDSVDAVVTDPPAGISFMGKAWDGDKGGRQQWIAWMADVMRECHRVLKPGGHALVWALPRTSHWTGTAIEDAGFEIRDRIAHHFGSGFPKSLDVSKAIDKAAGAERTVISEYSDNGRKVAKHQNTHGAWDGNAIVSISAPATPDAEQWDGWGTALKPATEDWWLARKPLSEPTVAANVLRWGTGAINVDGCRIGVQDAEYARNFPADRGHDGRTRQSGFAMSSGSASTGRWPANVILSHSIFCVPTGTKRVKGANGGGMKRDGEGNNVYGMHTGHASVQAVGYADPDGYETVEAWECHESCPVALLDAQSGVRKSGLLQPWHRVSGLPGTSLSGSTDGSLNSTHGPSYGDTGGASRFFYVAKASRTERNIGLDDLPERPLLWSAGTQNPGSFQSENTNRSSRNHHPTVKPIELMRYLIRLITPPGGIVLDPFCGSGTTAVAAALEGVNWIAIEREAEYVEIAGKRIAAVAAAV